VPVSLYGMNLLLLYTSTPKWPIVDLLKLSTFPFSQFPPLVQGEDRLTIVHPLYSAHSPLSTRQQWLAVVSDAA